MPEEKLLEMERVVCDAVDAAFQSEQVQWLARLVNQPSHTAARDDVEAAAAMIDASMEALALRRTLFPDPTGVYADHRIYSSPATDDDTIAAALVGHCDTVFPRELGFLKFRQDEPDSESGGDHVRGPGVLDMKSGLSVIVFALEALKRTAPEKFASLKIRFVCNTDEEVGSPSSHALFEQLAPKTNMAMVFEAGREGDRIITARKGTGGYSLRVVGKEAHAGNQHAEGISAIHVLALLIPRLEDLTSYQRGTTVNVGMIEGGTAKNTVPGSARCSIDVRITTLEEARRIESALHQIAGQPFDGLCPEPQRLGQARVQLQGVIRRLPMEPTSAIQRLRESYETYALAQGLAAGEAPLQGGGSDANLLAAAGVPCIDGLGPYGKCLHSPKEWCSLDSLRRRTKALACFLLAGETDTTSSA